MSRDADEPKLMDANRNPIDPKMLQKYLYAVGWPRSPAFRDRDSRVLRRPLFGAACLGLRPAPEAVAHPAKRVAAYAADEVGHVTPSGLLRSNRKLLRRQREPRQQDAARDRINTGVFVFTRVNASGIRQLREKWAVCGSRRGNQGCCGVNVMKTKHRCWNRLPGALTRGSLRCAVRKGSPLRSDRCAAPFGRP